MYDLTRVSAPISSGRPTAKPIRQPVIEKLLDSEKNSSATSRAPGDLEDARRPITVEGQVAVGVVVRQQDAVAAADGHRALEVLQRRDRGRRVVGIVDEHQLGPPEHRLRDLLEIEQEVVLRPQRRDVRLGAGQDGAAEIGLVARLGHDGDVARD